MLALSTRSACRTLRAPSAAAFSTTRTARNDQVDSSKSPNDAGGSNNSVDTPARKMTFKERGNIFDENALVLNAITSRPEFFEMPEVESMRLATIPNNWLGYTPFGTNPSFKPPPPVSDSVRTAIYEQFMHDPEKNNVRVVAARYHLSLKRVDAILRLKGQEAAWVKGITLQTGFQKGMEYLLDVKKHPTQEMRELRRDTDLVDELEHDENRDATRQRYQRQYWESVVEDGSKEPVLPGSIEAAKRAGKRHAYLAEQTKAGPRFMPKIPESRNITGPNATPAVQVATKPGRPSMLFIDVKGKFINAAELERRKTESERRSAKTTRTRLARRSKK